MFDVNETLVDMTYVKKKVNNALGSKRGFKLWFTQLLQYSLVDTITGSYHDFGAIAGATLEKPCRTCPFYFGLPGKKQCIKNESSKKKALRTNRQGPR